jgi:hypothetical protein
MRVPETYKCELCDKHHASDANHWFHGHVVNGGVLLLPWGSTMWDEAADIVRDVINVDAVHLCGIEHAMQWVSRELSSKPVPKKEPVK